MTTLRSVPIHYLRLLGAAQDKILCGPEKISIGICSVCNIQCNYCSYHSPLSPLCRQHKPASFLNLKTIKKIVSTAALWGVKQITLSGDGEPTRHPDIAFIIHAIKEKKLSLNLCTNGTFPSELVPAIAKADKLYINLCAPDKISYRRLQAPRSPELFEQILSNINKISKISKRYKHPETKIAFIITRENYRLIAKMLGFVDKLSIHSIRFKLFRSAPGIENLALTAEDTAVFLKTMTSLIKTSRPLKHNLAEICDSLTKHATEQPDCCLTGWHDLFISPHQRVSFCCLNRNLEIGDLRKHSLRTIWESRKAQIIRLKGKYHFPQFACSACKTCLWRTENDQRISAIAHIATPTTKPTRSNLSLTKKISSAHAS
ncbi:MAG: radical SAM protein [Candidatus Omnitrophica bacterium]|nr:radical SAM protein [Candidatus Omnitrophota bacterium]